MMLRFTLSVKGEQDPGDLLLEADHISAVLEGRGEDGSLTAMIYTVAGARFHVRDDKRDTQDRVLSARGDIGGSTCVNL